MGKSAVRFVAWFCLICPLTADLEGHLLFQARVGKPCE